MNTNTFKVNKTNIEITNIQGSDVRSKKSPDKPLRVLFLSSDTGGGHRASAEALGAQFQALYPNSTYDLLDIIQENSHPPFNKLVESYKHLSAHPQQWNLLYKISNTQPVETVVRTHLKITTERSIRKRIMSYNPMPDVVISVHPLMNAVPVLACQNISSETGRHLPMFTVVTDLGSGHVTWFDKGVEKLFIASEQIRDLAIRKNVPREKLVMSGLPIRQDFAIQAERLGFIGRTSLQGKIYQMQVRDKLGIVREKQSNLDWDCSMDLHRVVLVMGGGEGVGSLSNIVDELYSELVHKQIMATVIVVCGRNENLKASLETRDWDKALLNLEEKENRRKGIIRKEIGILGSRIASLPFNVFKKYQKGNNRHQESIQADDNKNVEETKDGTSETKRELDPHPSSESQKIIKHDNVNAMSAACTKEMQVIVHPLGFVTNIAEYMVAADILVTKAGPGTIAEAASVGLPVMLTSYLPGQEEGNVDFVLEHEFGDYKADYDPLSIANTVTKWLNDPNNALLRQMSISAKEAGRPKAAEEIVRNIGTSVHRWKELHPEENAKIPVLNHSISQVSC